MLRALMPLLTWRQCHQISLSRYSREVDTAACRHHSGTDLGLILGSDTLFCMRKQLAMTIEKYSLLSVQQAYALFGVCNR